MHAPHPQGLPSRHIVRVVHNIWPRQRVVNLDAESIIVVKSEGTILILVRKPINVLVRDDIASFMGDRYKLDTDLDIQHTGHAIL